MFSSEHSQPETRRWFWQFTKEYSVDLDQYEAFFQQNGTLDALLYLLHK
jgi:hypothetical protein